MRPGRPPPLGRLTRRPEYVRASREGRAVRLPTLTVQGRRRGGDEPIEGLRIGFTLTRKVGHATERNRIRRRLRAAVLEAGSPLREQALDAVVIGRREALAAPFRTLVDDLSRGLAAAAVQARPRSGKPRRPAAEPHSPGSDA